MGKLSERRDRSQPAQRWTQNNEYIVGMKVSAAENLAKHKVIPVACNESNILLRA